jgi:hypothetical protein
MRGAQDGRLVMRVDELTLRALAGEATSNELGELAELLASDARARERQRLLLEIEGALRGTSRPLNVAGPVLDQIHRGRTERVVRGVMRQLESRPERASAGAPVSGGPRVANARVAPRAQRRLWPMGIVLLASAAAAALVATRAAREGGPLDGLRTTRKGASPPLTDAPARPPSFRPPPPELREAPGGSSATSVVAEVPGLSAAAPSRPLTEAAPETAPRPAPAEAAAPAAGAAPPDSSVPLTVLAYDFETGELPRWFVRGHLIAGPCPPASTRCLIGTVSPYGAEVNSVVLERYSVPLFRFSPNQVLAFDYWVGAEAVSLYVQVWVRTKQQNYGLRLTDVVRETWVRAEVRLGDLQGHLRKDRLAEGDPVANVYIKGGRMGGKPLYIDNLTVLEYPREAVPVLSTAARMLPPP